LSGRAARPRRWQRRAAGRYRPATAVPKAAAAEAVAWRPDLTDRLE
jgi:hypothetical protein